MVVLVAGVRARSGDKLSCRTSAVGTGVTKGKLVGGPEAFRILTPRFTRVCADVKQWDISCEYLCSRGQDPEKRSIVVVVLCQNLRTRGDTGSGSIDPDSAGFSGAHIQGNSEGRIGTRDECY